MNQNNNGTRRGFLKKAAATAAGFAGLSAFAPSCSAKGAARAAGAPTGKPRVVIARDPAIWRGDSLDPDKVRTLLNRAMRELAGADSAADAWGSLFGAGDRVGMKLNLLAGRTLSSTPELADAIIDGLLSAGVKGSNVVAFERSTRELRKAGFTPGTGRGGARFVGTDSPDVGYDRNLTVAGEVGSLVCRVASEFSSALVNVPVLKDHDLAGFSGALKNYFGAIHNPNKLHENGCDPYIADLNTMPVFRDKTRLIVMDATTAQYHAGPSYKPEYAWRFSGVIVGTDPVALDTVGCKIVEDRRKAEGYPTLEEDDRPPAYIASAAARNLGENDIGKIDVVEI